MLWLSPSGPGRRRGSPRAVELYDVLGAGEGSLVGPGVLLAVELGQLQHRHIAEWTDFPHLQPLDEAPGGGHRHRGESVQGCYSPSQISALGPCTTLDPLSLPGASLLLNY